MDQLIVAPGHRCDGGAYLYGVIGPIVSAKSAEMATMRTYFSLKSATFKAEFRKSQ